jgi:hypothetical protein
MAQLERIPMNRHLLLESLLGHLALLAEKHPKKAASLVARRARRYIAQRIITEPGRAAPVGLQAR